MDNLAIGIASTVFGQLIFLGIITYGAVIISKNKINRFKRNIAASYVDGAQEDIWKNFDTEFLSFNDSWEMELNSPEKYIDLHKNRYQNPKCKQYKFLFFSKQYYNSFSNFVKFHAMVHFKFPKEVVYDNSKFIEELERTILNTKNMEKLKNLETIEVYINSVLSPNETFFLGYKKKKKVTLQYFSTDNNHVMPEKIIKSESSIIWNGLERKWYKSVDISNNSNIQFIPGKRIFEYYIANYKQI